MAQIFFDVLDEATFWTSTNRKPVAFPTKW